MYSCRYMETSLIFPVELTDDTIVIAPRSERHTHTVILLHGRDSEAAEFQSEFFQSQDSAGHLLDKDLFPTVRWVFPKAGVEDFGSSGIKISQWFGMTVTERPHENEEQQLAGLVASVEKIATIVREEAKIVGYDNIILGGISQGCATAVNALCPSVKAPDWILDGSFATHQEDGVAGQRIAFVTAHNALIVVTIDRLEATCDTDHAVLNPTVPGSNCISYTAHVKWISESRCLIASGTAFGDVIVWSAELLQASSGRFEAIAQVHYTFSAHEGSVFGVQISSGVETFNEKRLLASCSDDRTIRIWDISDLSAQSSALTDVQRDTGFGTKSEHEGHAPPCLAKAMGHMSRIWHVRFLPGDHCANVGRDHRVEMRIMSFGEDASNITWALNSSPDRTPSAGGVMLRQVACQTAHAGKHVWSVAVSAAGQVATGGCDGAIAIRSRDPACATPTLLDLFGAMEGKDSLRSYDFVAAHRMIAVTETGRVLEVSIPDDDNVTVSTVSEALPDLNHYSVTAGVPGALFMAGSTGVILAYDHQSRTVNEFARMGGKKVAGMFTYIGEDGVSFSLLVSSLGCAEVQLFEEISLGTRYRYLKSVQHVPLKLPAGYVVTSFARYKNSEQTIVALGSRQGSIAVYGMLASASAEPALVFQAHGQESVTALRWSGNTYLHSVGRDGAHAMHRITMVKGMYGVEIIHKLTLPFGPNVEGMSIDSCRLLLWGFRGKQFVVYDASSNREIMSVECGGAHRSFAFQPQESGGTFVWNKASKVYYQTQSVLPYALFHSGWHGREVKSMAISPNAVQIIATGAEDTDIKLCTIDESSGDLRCLQTLRKHNTGIQHLQWSTDGHYLFSSGGSEEFFVWRVTFDVPDIGLGVCCDSAHPRSGTSDLRIMGFAIQEENNEDGYRVTMAYSDSSIKMWKYGCQQWSLIAAGDYLTACLTHAAYLDGCPSTLLTAATDGHVALWTQDAVGSILTWSGRPKIHQNAVLVATHIRLSTGGHVFFAGGDDNAISMTTLIRDQTRTRILRMPRAHAAAVTGISVLRHSHDKILLASASIDQKIKVWEILMGDGMVDREIRVKKLWTCPTSVADVSSLETCHLAGGEIGLVVCGVGIEVLRLQGDVKEHRKASIFASVLSMPKPRNSMSHLPQEFEARLHAMEEHSMSQMQRMTGFEKALADLVASAHRMKIKMDDYGMKFASLEDELASMHRHGSKSCAGLQAAENQCNVESAQEEYKIDLAEPSNFVKRQVDLGFLNDLWSTIYIFPCMITIIWLTLLHTESDDMYMDHILVHILPTIGVMAAVASFCSSVLVLVLKLFLKQEIMRITLERTAARTTVIARVCARWLVKKYSTRRAKLAQVGHQLRPEAGTMRRFLKSVAIIGISALLYASGVHFKFATLVVNTVSFIIAFYIKKPLFLLPAVAIGLLLALLFQAKEGVDGGQQATVEDDKKAAFWTIVKDIFIAPFMSCSSTDKECERECESEEEYESEEKYESEGKYKSEKEYESEEKYKSEKEYESEAEGAGCMSHNAAEQESDVEVETANLVDWEMLEANDGIKMQTGR
ncbi:WD40 repeat-like protein [Teratosphaeria nubilosa]|uniref:WD40 repeat-like protein n=1 Tax=Teratosphaeria nubilosa TaxID=161662 RepID=A0A6G1KTP7_9PEZI|nr:WD40 repeat-like protein [Teratosphaeria nubilosa]